MDTNLDFEKIRQTFTDYWSIRAQTYSDDMSKIDFRDDWKAELKQRITNHFPGKAPGSIRVLELATGHGYFACILAELGFNVTAIDLAPGMLEVAKMNCAKYIDSINFMHMDAEELTFADDSFDVVFCRFLTWLLPRPDKAYSEWYRVLKKDGLVLIYDTMMAKERRLSEQEVLAEEKKDNPYRDELVNRTGMTAQLYNDLIRLSGELEIGYLNRPDWDVNMLTSLGMDAVSENVTRLSSIKSDNAEPSQLMLVKGIKR